MGNDPDYDLNFLILIILAGFSLFVYEKIPIVLNFLDSTQGKLVSVAFFIAASILAVCFGKKRISQKRKETQIKNQIYKPSKESTFCGFEMKTKKPIYVNCSQRKMHTQIIGTTNAGKTESVILPWAIQDIQKGLGLIIIDGKSDRGLLNKLWAYTCKYGRESDFFLFSLSQIEESSQYNPLIGQEPEEVIERVFSSFEMENSYFKNIQFEVFSNIIRLFFESGEVPTFKKVYKILSDRNYLRQLNRKVNSVELKDWATGFLALSPTEQEQRVSGLKTSISHFAFGKTAELFDTETPTIDIDEALKKNKIIYFQLPVLLSPFLGRATGKMILQNLQCAVANRHRSKDRDLSFFSVFLDDFTEYLYPGFVSLLNKSRSANIGIVFAHQALGDIKSLGDSIANTILTNANLKIFMRGNDPDSAEYYSKVIGTKKALKLTERKKKTFLNDKYTGDQSAREVDEFIIHPNTFKKELGTGEAIVVIPFFSETHSLKVTFSMAPDIPFLDIPKIPKKKTAEILGAENENRSTSNQDDPLGLEREKQ